MSVPTLRRIALAAAAGLLACAASAQTTITFRFHDPEAPQMRAALDEFEKQNPGIKVTMQRANWSDGRQQYLREAAAGSGPDVVQIVYVWARPFGAAKALRPLDDFIAKGGLGLKGWDDFIARDLAQGPDGKTYAIPYSTDTFAMLVNRNALADAGVTRIPQTWTELLETSRTIKAKTGKSGFAFPAGSCSTPAIWFYMNFYWWSKGVSLVDQAPDGKYQVAATPAQVADAMNYFNTYVKDGLNPQTLAGTCSYSGPEMVEALVGGEVAMASLTDAVVPRVMAAWKERNPGKPNPFVTVIHPRDTGPSTTHFGGRMIAISPNSKQPAEAWKLVQFLTRPDPTFTKHLTNYTPSQQEAVKRQKVEPGMEGFKEQLQFARTWGAYATGPLEIASMWNALGRATGAVFIKQKTAEQAGAEYVNLLKTDLARAQK